MKPHIYCWSGFASDKFEKILEAGHAQKPYMYSEISWNLFLCVTRSEDFFKWIAKPDHQYMVLFFELSYYERTLKGQNSTG